MFSENWPSFWSGAWTTPQAGRYACLCWAWCAKIARAFMRFSTYNWAFTESPCCLLILSILYRMDSQHRAVAGTIHQLSWVKFRTGTVFASQLVSVTSCCKFTDPCRLTQLLSNCCIAESRQCVLLSFCRRPSRDFRHCDPNSVLGQSLGLFSCLEYSRKQD